jgi:hypothetical protein
MYLALVMVSKLSRQLIFALASDLFAFSIDILDITRFVYFDLQDGDRRNALWVIDRWMENNI